VTFKTVVILGRRNCSRCKRWRYAHDFPPRKNSRKEVIGPQSICHSCLREYQRALPPEKKAQQRRQQRIHMRKKRRKEGVPEREPRILSDYQPGSVRREPFAAWLQTKVNEVGKMEFMRRTGFDQRSIRAVLSGWDRKSSGLGSRKRKLRQLDYVSFTLVDKVMTAWGDHDQVNRLYPPDDLGTMADDGVH
jgi:hypothetical protein